MTSKVTKFAISVFIKCEILAAILPDTKASIVLSLSTTDIRNSQNDVVTVSQRGAG